MDFHRASRETIEVTEQTAVEKPRDRTAHEVLNLIRELPDAYRETLVLRFVEGMTGPEIAARVGLTPASVRVNLHRGMKLLRQRMGVSEARAKARAGKEPENNADKDVRAPTGSFMNDTYLWDQTGEADAEVQKMEQLHPPRLFDPK